MAARKIDFSDWGCSVIGISFIKWFGNIPCVIGAKTGPKKGETTSENVAEFVRIRLCATEFSRIRLRSRSRVALVVSRQRAAQPGSGISPLAFYRPFRDVLH